jgi:hypothetical protein
VAAETAAAAKSDAESGISIGIRVSGECTPSVDSREVALIRKGEKEYYGE